MISDSTSYDFNIDISTSSSSSSYKFINLFINVAIMSISCPIKLCRMFSTHLGVPFLIITGITKGSCNYRKLEHTRYALGLKTTQKHIKNPLDSLTGMITT